MMLGIMATINQEIDFETANIIIEIMVIIEEEESIDF